MEMVLCGHDGNSDLSSDSATNLLQFQVVGGDALQHVREEGGDILSNCHQGCGESVRMMTGNPRESIGKQKGGDKWMCAVSVWGVCGGTGRIERERGERRGTNHLLHR